MSRTPRFDDSSDPGNRLVLVVEDVPADRVWLEVALRSRGYDARLTADPIEALKVASEGGICLAIVSADIKNGFNLCMRLKKDQALRRIPLLLTTAKTPPEVIRKHRMLPTRADAYLMKPFAEDSFAGTLAELLPEDFRSISAAGGHELTDRTLVSPAGMESAVVHYVEEEVRGLKDAMSRMAEEKASLRVKLAELESELKSERDRLESGLKDLMERHEAAASRETADAARREGWRQGLEDGRREGVEQGRREGIEAGRKEGIEAGRRDGIEEGRKEGIEAGRREGIEEGRKEGLEAGRAEGWNEATVKAAEEASALGARVRELEAVASQESGRDLAELKVIFHRLEIGYKESISRLEAEKSDLEGTIVGLSSEVERLEERLAAALGVAAEAERLRDEASRAVAAEERCEELAGTIQAREAALSAIRGEADALRTRAEKAGLIEEEAEHLRSELDEARSQIERFRRESTEARSDAERTKGLVARLKSILVGEAEPPPGVEAKSAPFAMGADPDERPIEADRD